MDELYTNFYPDYVGGSGGDAQHTPLRSDIAPLQVVSAAGYSGLAPAGPPQGHHMPLIMWALLFLGGAFVLMHVADR